MENKTLLIFVLAATFSARARAEESSAAASAVTPAPATAPVADAGPAVGTSTAEEEPHHNVRISAKISYLTSRTAETDTRSFRASATDDTGSITTGSSQPNLNYVSAGLSMSPWQNQTFGLSTLQNIDSPAYLASHSTGGPGGGGGFGSGVFSGRYGYRFSPHYSLSAGETFVTGRKWSDPSLNLSYRARNLEDQGLSPRLGLGLSVPTTERSHNDQLITRATARSGLSYVNGRWTTSGSLAYSKPLYMHPENLSPTMFDDTTPGTGAGDPNAANPNTHQPHGNGPGHGPGGPGHHHGAPADPSDPNAPVYVPTAADIAMREREKDRTTSSMGLTYKASDRLKIGTGAGVSYVETFRQKAIWLTNARLVSAAYRFWKMEAGSSVQLYSTSGKYAHPSLPSMMAVGFSLTYFMGQERDTPLN